MLLAPAVPQIDYLNLEVMSQAEMEYQRKLVTLREYYFGDQGAKVPERLLEFMPSLSKGFEFKLNLISVIIQAVTEYLNVKTWDSDDDDLSEWANKLWLLNKMDARQDDVHENTLVDGEHFVIVTWDNDKERVVWTPTRSYTSKEIGGDDFGCRMVYNQNDINQDPLYAIKRWSEVDLHGHVVEYKTLYYPNKIEKYYRDNTPEWQQRQVEGEEWPAPWVDAEGNPLGIPVIHFINKRGSSEIEDVIAIQDATNKSAIDTLISSDLTAFRIYIALGWIPTTDGQPPKEDRSNWATIEPGMVYGTTNKDAKFQAIEPPSESIEGLSTLTQQFIVWGALTSGTPVTRVITTKLVASDETLKQQDKPLENRVALRRSLIGHSWISCMDLSRKLEMLYGKGGLSNVDLGLLWGSRLHMDESELSALESKQRLGIPQEQIWKELGYSQAKIRVMKTQKAEQEAQTNSRQGAQDNAQGR